MDAKESCPFYQTLSEAKAQGVHHLLRVYRQLALRHHPDKPGGGHAAMAALSKAYRDVMSITSHSHNLGGSGSSTNGSIICEMCGEGIPVTASDLEAGFTEFECRGCGYVLYCD